MIRGKKPSVPAAVDAIITHNHAVYTCMKQRLVNYHALATTIKSEVEKLLGKPTSVNTIVVAIKRFSDALAKGNPEPPLELLRDAKLTLTSDVVDVTIRPKRSDFSNIFRRIVEVTPQLAEPVDMFKLSNLIKLVADEEEYDSSMRAVLGKGHIVRELKGLSRLSLHLSPGTERNPALPSFISDLLYRQGVSVLHAYIDEDTVMILDKEDGPRAYEILEREIMRSERNPNRPKSKTKESQ